MGYNISEIGNYTGKFTLSIPFMGYFPLQQFFSFHSQYFQFPLWDTDFDKQKDFLLLLFFQFPLWDTDGLMQCPKCKEYVFQFPLWDTCILYCCLSTTHYSILSIPFMGYKSCSSLIYNNIYLLSIPFMGYYIRFML